ncbi:MAG: peroxiredoxin, partial [Thermoproteus sp.]
ATGLGALIFSKRPRTRLIGLPWIARLYVEWRLKRLGARPIGELVREALGAGINVYIDEPVAKMLGVEPLEGVKTAGSLTFLALSREADLVLTF